MAKLKIVFLLGIGTVFIFGIIIAFIKFIFGMLTQLSDFILRLPFISFRGDVVIIPFALVAVMGVLVYFVLSKTGSTLRDLIGKIPLFGPLLNLTIDSGRTISFLATKAKKQQIDDNIYNKWAYIDLIKFLPKEWFPNGYPQGPIIMVLVAEITFEKIKASFGKGYASCLWVSTPNPITGWTILFPLKALRSANITLEQGIKFISSGGFLQMENAPNAQEKDSHDNKK